MNSRDKNAIACYANDVLWMWNSVIKRAEIEVEEPLRRSWFMREARQAYQDAMQFMVRNDLIETFDVTKIQVKIDGVWRDDRKMLKFVKAKNTKKREVS